MTQAPKHGKLWIPKDHVPEPAFQRPFFLEPLQERHAELDFAAFMSCRERLQRELQWGNWPPADFTLEANRQDLGRHYAEFVRGEAFAFTVLNPQQTKCLGCIYIERCLEIDGAQLAWWLIDSERSCEELLVKQVLHWLHEAWQFASVLLPIWPANGHAIKLAESLLLSLKEDISEGPLAEHDCYLSRRSDAASVSCC